MPPLPPPAPHPPPPRGTHTVARHHPTRPPMITVPPWATASAALLALALVVGLCEWVVHTVKKGR